MQPPVIDTKAIGAICRAHGVSRLSLIGSAIHGNFSADSDVDLLVDFLPGQHIGYFKLATLQLELEAVIGCKVDLKTPFELSRYFRDQVMREAVVQYAA
jgi:predicted nucleotidyltransferase